MPEPVQQLGTGTGPGPGTGKGKEPERKRPASTLEGEGEDLDEHDHKRAKTAAGAAPAQAPAVRALTPSKRMAQAAAAAGRNIGPRRPAMNPRSPFNPETMQLVATKRRKGTLYTGRTRADRSRTERTSPLRLEGEEEEERSVAPGRRILRSNWAAASASAAASSTTIKSPTPSPGPVSGHENEEAGEERGETDENANIAAPAPGESSAGPDIGNDVPATGATHTPAENAAAAAALEGQVTDTEALNNLLHNASPAPPDPAVGRDSPPEVRRPLTQAEINVLVAQHLAAAHSLLQGPVAAPDDARTANAESMRRLGEINVARNASIATLQPYISDPLHRRIHLTDMDLRGTAMTDGGRQVPVRMTGELNQLDEDGVEEDDEDEDEDEDENEDENLGGEADEEG
ncbi:hypothetical protein M8818_005964 [Zalaria obscura]|uniref:Uncharacterized protein n=1 Tax=Zalaria obscura TaxID=2024903 RepID=A0ACC3S7L1_9PEZI